MSVFISNLKLLFANKVNAVLGRRCLSLHACETFSPMFLFTDIWSLSLKTDTRYSYSLEKNTFT